MWSAFVLPDCGRVLQDVTQTVQVLPTTVILPVVDVFYKTSLRPFRFCPPLLFSLTVDVFYKTSLRPFRFCPPLLFSLLWTCSTRRHSDRSGFAHHCYSPCCGRVLQDVTQTVQVLPTTVILPDCGRVLQDVTQTVQVLPTTVILPVVDVFYKTSLRPFRFCPPLLFSLLWTCSTRRHSDR